MFTKVLEHYDISQQNTDLASTHGANALIDLTANRTSVPAPPPTTNDSTLCDHRFDDEVDLYAAEVPSCWNCGSVNHMKNRCPHPIFDRRRLPPWVASIHNSHPAARGPQSIHQAGGQFQPFYPIVAPLGMGATYPAIHPEPTPTAHPGRAAPAMTTAPARAADLYCPRYFAGRGPNLSAGPTSQSPHTSRTLSRAPSARICELPEGGLDPQDLSFNSIQAGTPSSRPIVDTGASHHLTGDCIGSVLFPTEDGGEIAIPGVLYSGR